jgi:hypothetical protein
MPLFWFAHKKTAHAGQINGEKGRQRTPPFFFVGGGVGYSIN